MRCSILILVLSLSLNGYSQSKLPVLGNFQYQSECEYSFVYGWYMSDTTFMLVVDDSESEKFYQLTGKMKFEKNFVTLQYLDDHGTDFPEFEIGKEEQFIIENHGELLVPTGDSFVFCSFLYRAEVRY